MGGEEVGETSSAPKGHRRAVAIPREVTVPRPWPARLSAVSLSTSRDVGRDSRRFPGGRAAVYFCARRDDGKRIGVMKEV